MRSIRTLPFCIVQITFFLWVQTVSAQQKERFWKVNSTQSIKWELKNNANLPHSDNIEMAGKRVAAIVSYAIDTSGHLSLSRQIFFPQIHPEIKSTDPGWFVYRAYAKPVYKDDVLPKLYANHKEVVPGKLEQVEIDGILGFRHAPSSEGLVFERQLFPSPSQRMFIEKVTITNTTSNSITLKGANKRVMAEGFEKENKYATAAISDAPAEINLQPGESSTFGIYFIAKKETENFPTQTLDDAFEERKSFLNEMSSSLILETPNSELNTLFEFSKIRASESIFESRLGLIHSPGGGRYYVGIWANDQAEYVSPFFPFLGYKVGNESAMSTYRAFAREVNDEFKKIRYAFEVEGTVPPFLLDRGDAAMIAYGVSQFALALGDKETAEELWPLIVWCLEYNKRQLNPEGVVKSESDEMEGRIATGDANLSTSSLYYGALDHAADLGKSLGKPRKILNAYEREAKRLAEAIENYFGANVEGLETYKYYKEHKYLRHWICLPLVVGIHNRKAATIEALFDRLWTENGVHVEKNSDNEAISKIFWDRATLYALRGTFLSGATDVSLDKLEQFSHKRLLGNRVPYVVEAFPEGNMAEYLLRECLVLNQRV